MELRHNPSHSRATNKEWILFKFFLIFGLSYLTGAVLLYLASEHCKQQKTNSHTASVVVHNSSSSSNTSSTPSSINPNNALQHTTQQHKHSPSHDNTVTANPTNILSQFVDQSAVPHDNGNQWDVTITVEVNNGLSAAENYTTQTTTTTSMWRMIVVRTLQNNETAVDA